MATRTITLAAFAYSGAPLAGLSPTWFALKDAVSGMGIVATSITALGGGLYKTTIADTNCGIVDFGATASPRYVFVSSVNVASFAAFDLSGAPLAGLTPTFATCVNGLTGASVTPPAIVDLGSGCYSAPAMGATTCGTVSLGATASPSIIALSISDGQDSIGPQAGSFSPATGATITPSTPISFEVTGRGKGIALAALVAKFGTLESELVYDGAMFTHLYAAQSTAEAIANGVRFTLVRATGWPTANGPTLVPLVVDTSGNTL